MSTVKEVLERYDAKVPFPLTPEKIEAAGHNVAFYLGCLVGELMNADDADDPRTGEILSQIDDILQTRGLT